MRGKILGTHRQRNALAFLFVLVLLKVQLKLSELSQDTTIEIDGKHHGSSHIVQQVP